MGGDRKKRWRMLPLIQIEIAQAGRGKEKNAAEASKVIINNERHRNTPDAARVCVWECVCVRVCVAVFGFSTIWPCSLDVALLYFYMQVGAD